MITKPIPLHSWLGTDNLLGRKQLLSLERFLGDGHLAFNSTQNAIQAILEALGTTTDPIPVVLSVTAPPDTFAAVLRAGAQPIMFDIDRDTLQPPEDLMATVVDELGSCVFIINRPVGTYSSYPDLEKQVTILDSRTSVVGANDDHTFVVRDFTDICGAGASVDHAYADQLRVIDQVRSGVGGLSAAMPDVLAAVIESRLHDLNDFVEACDDAKERYIEGFDDVGDVFVYEPTEDTQPLVIRVPDAQRVLVHLNEHKVKAQGIKPLCEVEEVSRRLVGDVSYPAATDLAKHIVALPVHSGVHRHVETIVDLVKEVL